MDATDLKKIKSQLDQAYEAVARGKDYENALALCNKVLQIHPSLSEGLKTRAQIHAYVGEFDKAIQDISTVIGLQREEPDDYFSRGRWHLDNDNASAAVEDMTRVIHLGIQANFNYYTESAHFYRAWALLKLGRKDEALADCTHVRDEFQVYMRNVGIVSRSTIEKKAQAKP